MMVSPDDYRREATLVELIADTVSLLPEKHALLAEARSLRRRAAEIEERIAAEAAPAPAEPGCTGGRRLLTSGFW